MSDERYSALSGWNFNLNYFLSVYTPHVCTNSVSDSIIYVQVSINIYSVNLYMFNM